MGDASQSPAPPAVEFFEELGGRFRDAATVRGIAERDISIAGVPIRLRFAGEELLEAIHPPFAHLDVAGVAPEAEICVFEGRRSGVEAPAMPGAMPTAGEAANPIARYQGEDATILAGLRTGELTAGLGDGSSTVLYVPDPAGIPASDWVGRFRGALMLVLAPRGLRLLHAGAVGGGGRGALISGRSGSGKTTLSVACALAGMEICADDYVVLGEGESPVVYALQSTAAVSEDSARMLGLEGPSPPAAGPRARLGSPPKAPVDLGPLAAAGLTPQMETGALVVPLRSDRAEPALRSASAARGLQSLAPSTVFQQLPRDDGLLAAMARLVSRLECFELELSADMEANAAAVQEVVDGLA